MEKHRRFSFGLAAILLAAVAFRVVAAAAQLPYHYQADEFQVIERALKVGAGELNPGLFTWPGTVVIYLNFIAFGCYFVFLRLAGVVSGAASFADYYWRAPGGFYFLGRLISVCFGGLTVAAVWRWTRRVASAAAAAAAAAMVTLAPAAVLTSGLALPDAAAVALGAAALAAAGKGARGGWKTALAAGILLGLGTAAKYHVLLYAPALAVALGGSRANARENLRLFGLAAAGIIGGFIAGCPFAVIAFRDWWRDVALMVNRPGMITVGPAAPYTLGVTLPLTFGWPLTAAAAFGLVGLYIRRDRFAAAALIAAAPILLISFIRPLPPKYMLLLIPPAGAAVGAAVDAVGRSAVIFRRVAASAVFTIVFLIAAGVAIYNVAFAAQTDTRTIALRYIETHIPAETRILTEAVTPDVDGPPVWLNRAAATRLLTYYETARTGSPGRWGYFLKTAAYPYGHKTYDVYLLRQLPDERRMPRPAYAIWVKPDDPAYFAEQGLPYGAATATWGRRYTAFLQRYGHPVYVVSGKGRPGPAVELYYLP